LFLFLSGAFYTSCTQQLVKKEAIPSKLSKTAYLKSVDNFLQEAFLSYQQGSLTEVTRKLEAAVNLVQGDSPTSSVATLYTMLAFFQNKSGDSAKADITFKVIQGLFENLKSTHTGFEVLSKNLKQFAGYLQIADRLQFWELIRPVARDSLGKSAEAYITCQIAEAYNGLKNIQKAYDLGVEARQLARESGELPSEVHASIVISMSLIGLGRFQEVESPLQEVLPKTEKNNQLKMLVLGARGMVYNAQGRADLAVQDFREGISLAQSLGDLNRLAQLQSGLGNIYLSIGKPREAVQEFLEALSHFESVNDELNVANSEGVIAQAYLETGAFEDASRHASRAADLFRRLGNRTEEAKTLRTVGQSLAEANKVDEALEILKKAVDIQVEERDRNDALKTFMLMNKLLKKMGRIEILRRNLLAGLDANAAFFGDKKAEAYIRNELGDVYKELGSFLEALVEYMQAFKLYEQLSNKKLQIITLLNQASVFAYLDDQDRRIQILAIAEQIGADLNDPEAQVLILNDFAEAFRDLGGTVEAFEAHLEALRVSRQISKKNQIFPLISISDFYRDWIGEYTRALNYLNEALTLAKEIGDRESENNILLGIARTYLKMGRSEDAARLCREALMIIRDTKAEKLPYETLALECIGSGLLNQGLYDSAFEVYQEWLQIALKYGSLSQIQKAYSNLGYVYLKLGNYEEAVKAFKIAIEQTENIRNRIIEEHRAGFFKTSLSPYDNLVEALYQLYRVGGPQKGHLAEEGLDFAEASKARTWKEHFSKSRLRFIQESIPLEVRDEEGSLLNKRATAYLAYIKAFHGYNVPDIKLSDQKNDYDAAHKKWTAFVEQVRRRYPNYAALRYPEPVHLGELAIRDEESLVVYKVGIDWTYAWVIRSIEGQNKIIKFIRLPVRTDDIIKLVEKFITPFRKVKYEGFESEVASELFRAILLPPLEGVEFPKRLIIVPDGILNVVPFEALIIEPPGDRGLETPLFLQDKFLISYYPSATILTINRQTVPLTLPSKDTLLAVGDPVYGLDDDRLTKSQLSMLLEGEQKQESSIVTRKGKIRKGAQDQGYSFVRLKYSGVEVAKIKEVFGNRPGPRDLLIGFEATESHVKSKDLTRYQYLHFAVHGILAYDVPYLKEPALVLAVDPENKEDGFLTLSEIYGLKLNADLVTLSACKTGLGQRIPGEGVIGLSRAFIDAGSQAVLVSLWEVDDHSTALFMEEFYWLLAQGVNKVEALAKAKDYHRQKGYENPYFWAPFILIGG
jgi:CHAT domain-containing protein/tetratricopeptide (TPR) repeat protein